MESFFTQSSYFKTQSFLTIYLKKSHRFCFWRAEFWEMLLLLLLFPYLCQEKLS